MKFKYLDYRFLDILPPATRMETVDIADYSIKIAKKLQIIINFLPEHPLDYPFFETVEQLFGEKSALFNKLLTENEIPGAVFIFPVRNSFSAFLQKQNMKTWQVIFRKPEYPFQVKSLNKIAAPQGYTLISWFDFYMWLLMKAEKRPPGIPIVLSELDNDSRTAFFIQPGTSLKAVIEKTGTETDEKESMFFDHPFKGKSLSEDTVFTDIRPHSLIKVKKNTYKKTPFSLMLKQMVFERSAFSFSRLYNSSPPDIGNPCQKCLHCVQICPEKLAPLMISALYRNEDIKGAVKFLPQHCSDCGLCTYICPSAIPLLHNIQSLKKELGIPI